MKAIAPVVLLVLLAVATRAAAPAGPAPAEVASAANLVQEFKDAPNSLRQYLVAQKIVALHDTSVLPALVSWLGNDDRHLRGNAAFIFASLGDDRGFEVIRSMLTDMSDRPKGQGMPGGNWTMRAQINADRYWAVHLLGDLKDPRAVPLLVPLLHDSAVNYAVPWSLEQIGDRRAIPPLIETLDEKEPSMRILAIYALENLEATEALPRLHALINDNERNRLGDPVSVGDAAREAITILEIAPRPLDRRAIEPLLGALDDKSPTVRIFAIKALGKLGAAEALPRLRPLLSDNEKNFENTAVSAAAKEAISSLEAKPK